MIEIWEPRYKDMTLLIKSSRLTPGKDAMINVTKGSKAGVYLLPGEIISSLGTEIKTYGGRDIKFTIAPLSKLKKVEE